ncbi:MAG TPA: type IV secretory system conjugative DNA transfer family protein [Solirubrobacterales bacterium]
MSAAGLAIAAVLGVVLLCLHLLDRHLIEGRGARQRRAQGARWAARRDLRSLELAAPEPGRLVLGRHGRRLIAAERRASVVVVGPSTISLKTSGFAIPSVLEWQGPVVAASVKSDLLLRTLAQRESCGKAMVFDPAGVTGIESVKATPLSACGSWRGAMRAAHWLATSARAAGAGGLEDADFWYSAAEKLIAPLLYAAAASGKQMAEVIRWLNDGPDAEETVSDLLAESGSKDAQSAWAANWNREERQRSSIYTTAETILGAYADPRVLDASSAPEYTPAELLGGACNTLYLCAPAHEQERLRTVFAAMLCELVAVVYECSAQSGKPIDPPLLIVLDEAANIAPMPDLDVVASTGAGQGIQLVTVFQDLAQVRARYGARAETIVNNHRAKVFASGIADPETLRYVSQVIGDGEFRQRSETAGEQGRRTATVSSDYRDLAPANVVRGARPGSALLVYGHLPPAQLSLRPWFEDSELTALAEGSDHGD